MIYTFKIINLFTKQDHYMNGQVVTTGLYVYFLYHLFFHLFYAVMLTNVGLLACYTNHYEFESHL